MVALRPEYRKDSSHCYLQPNITLPPQIHQQKCEPQHFWISSENRPIWLWHVHSNSEPIDHQNQQKIAPLHYVLIAQYYYSVSIMTLYSILSYTEIGENLHFFYKTLCTRKFSTWKFFEGSTHGILTHSRFRICVLKGSGTHFWPCYSCPKSGEGGKTWFASKIKVV